MRLMRLCSIGVALAATAHLSLVTPAHAFDPEPCSEVYDCIAYLNLDSDCQGESTPGHNMCPGSITWCTWDEQTQELAYGGTCHDFFDDPCPLLEICD